MGINDVEVPAMVFKNKIYDVEVQAVGMRNNMPSTANNRKSTGKENK